MSSAAATPTVKTREHVYSMLEEIVGKKMSEIVEQRKAEREERKSEMADMIAAMGSANSNREAVKRNPSMDFGRYMRCLAMTRGDTGKSADYCKQKLGDNYVAKYLGETSFGAGGALVPPEFAAEIKQMILDAVEMESEYNRDLLPNGILGLNSNYINQYVKYLADRRLEELGFEAEYKVSNPAKWMATANDTLQLVNFFEATNTSYESNASAK